MIAGQDIGTALTPVSTALRDRARADARRTLAEADAASEQVLAGARAEADRILTEAREGGTADATAAMARELIRARRRARGLVLRARRDGYESLGEQCRQAVRRLRDEPGYAGLRDELVAAVRRALGPDATIHDMPDGGVVGETLGRRLDLSLVGYADRAMAAMGGWWEEEP